MNKSMMTTLISAGISIAIFLGGNWLVGNRIVDAKIETAKADAYQANVQVVQRVSALEEAVNTLKMDSTEIKRDVKELLRILR